MFLYLLFVLLLSATTTNFAEECDLRIISGDEGVRKSGVIQSPNFPNSYGVNLRCTYYLIGQAGERVEIVFEQFNVKGVLPRCQNDYVDVYTQVEDQFQDLLHADLHGRYCGSDLERLPSRLISMTNILIIGFYTASTVDSEDKGFSIRYKFIDGSVYKVGTEIPDVCGQTIRTVQSGTILSPTYPGMYPDHLFCFYKIHGSPGQRIKLTFVDIDLYYGGEHCPFDYIKVYDGPNNEADVIDTYCGRPDNFSIFSTTESLNIVFETKSGRAEVTRKTYLTYDEKQEKKIERRGFAATFEISNDFVSLDFVQGTHIRGTECDQVIYSGGETSGTITSPYYPNPYPLNIRCMYYIDGLQDKLNLEKVRIALIDLDIPQIGDSCKNNGFIRIITDGQSPDSEAGEKLCGTRSLALTTTNPRLLLLFDSHGQIAGRGFKAQYRFITDYAIPGTPATTSECYFTYRSSSVKVGTFISPRHPSYYPDSTTCTYDFIGLSTEQVRITFENFDVENGDRNCSRDHIQVFDVARSQSGTVSTSKDTLVGIYCGEKLPGPQMSEENSSRMKVKLTTNDRIVHAGFRARYEFIEKQPDRQCIYHYTGSGGSIESPNHPNKYYTNRTREWIINSRSRQATIMLVVHEFNMEGNPEGVGCGNCVLKIYTNNSGLPAYELCGENRSYLGLTILSQGNQMRLKFISSGKAVGGKGFVLSWTELLPRSGKSDGRCDGFQCRSSHYCIDSKLKCNRLPNCGHGDMSDETENCGPAHTRSGVLNVILGVVLTVIAIIVVIFCIVQLRRRRRRKQQEVVTVHYLTRSTVSEDDDLTPGAVGSQSTSGDVAVNGGHSLFREQTEKVSIV